MSFDKLVEEKIRGAIEAGEFDHLAGRSKPIDLKSYFDTPEDLRYAYSVLKSSGFVPSEAELVIDNTATLPYTLARPKADLYELLAQHFMLTLLNACAAQESLAVAPSSKLINTCGMI